ncbi:MAG: Coenzyme F420 hydrogenase/dehydrogenase, beta subunit C-terminal domain [Sedimentisphaerales bacterium]
MTGNDQTKHESHLPPCESLEVCTGCGACAAVCPVSCITMQPNDEGFLYPVTDTDICTDCGICRRICPVGPEKIAVAKMASEGDKSGQLAVFAAWHLDEHIRRESSSGGVFTALAENILAQGGIVVGAAFDEQFVVRHILIESSKDLHRLRGSKYVQSEVAPALYRQIRDLLEQGRPVLFSGTPCQVAGLRSFLGQSYEKLFCCDLVCHGVPSPLLFKRYVQNYSLRENRLLKIDFRNKTTGWKKFGVRQHYQNESRLLSVWADPYMAAFLRDYVFRPACYACEFKGVNRFGDLTIADFWGVWGKYPEYDRDDKGTSLLLVNNKKGKVWLDACHSSLFLGPADLDTAIVGNPMLMSSCSRPLQRDMFYVDLNRILFNALIRKYNLRLPSLFRRALSGIKRRLTAVWGSVTGTLGFGKRNPT